MDREAKAKMLLAERRVRILAADEDSVTADVTGDSGLYRVSVYPAPSLTVKECTCDYTRKYHPYKADCSHVRAVLHVWRPDERRSE